MKGKISIFIIILLILIGGALFFLGWVQILVEENTYGVIFTKTHGYDEEVVQPGKFIWRIEKLIPTNFTIHLFPIDTRTITITSNGTLPSGDIYSSYLEGNPDFSYRMVYRISYQINYENLPDLVGRDSITPEKLPEFYEGLESRMVSAADDLIIDYFSDPESIQDISFLHDEISTILQNELSARFSFLNFLSITPREIRFPDGDLYRLGKEIYFDVMNIRKQQIAETMRLSAEKETEETIKIDLLKKYGALFTEYPVLLEYFSLLADTGNFNLSIPGLGSFQEILE